MKILFIRVVPVRIIRGQRSLAAIRDDYIVEVNTLRQKDLFFPVNTEL